MPKLVRSSEMPCSVWEAIDVTTVVDQRLGLSRYYSLNGDVECVAWSDFDQALKRGDAFDFVRQVGGEMLIQDDPR